MTSFNKLTFFHANIKQSEIKDSFQLAYDWIKSVQRNVNKFWAPCCNRSTDCRKYEKNYNIHCTLYKHQALF